MRTSFPTHRQLLLPILEVLAEQGPTAARHVAELVAEKTRLPEALRQAVSARREWGSTNLWRRHVRWAKQTYQATGVLKGQGIWELTEKGHELLANCHPGVCVTVYETEHGAMLWAEAETALGQFRDASIQLLFTSPPYPILRGKEYGAFSGEEYVERLCRFFRDATRVIAEDGSLVLNLMDCQAQPKVPTLSLYKEKLLIHLVERCGYHLCQNFFWSSSCKIPAGHWVTVRRQRVNSSVEHLFWLAKTPFPKVRQMEVLRPYSPRMQGILTRGGEKRSARPSGHGSCRLGFSRDHGGSIPGNLLSFPNGASNTPYHRYCRRHNLPRHPARFPMELPSFFIRLLTDPGDVVWDCFAGSNTTGKAAESLGRRWVSSEKALAYAVGSQGWFDMVPA